MGGSKGPESIESYSQIPLAPPPFIIRSQTIEFVFVYALAAAIVSDFTCKRVFMIRKLVILFVVLAIAATIAYKMDWLSRKGEKAYDKAKKTVIKEGDKMIDKTKDAIK